MDSSMTPQARDLFRSLADRVYRGDTTADVLEDVVLMVKALVPHADHVSISTLGTGRQLATVAASDEVARRMDQLETLAGEGPCLDSIVADAVQRDADIATASTWPRLRDLVLEQTPVRGMLGYRLLTGSGQSALNVFADRPGVLSPEVADRGALLAAFASVALAAAERRESADDLRRALDEDREVGKAIGLLMAAHSVSEAQAKRLLEDAAGRFPSPSELPSAEEPSQ